MAKIALITGSASGIARYLTGELLKEGYRVVATDLNEAGLTEQAEQLNWPKERLLLKKLDVRNLAEWEAVVEQTIETWGQIDLLLNIAGYAWGGSIYEIDPAEVDKIVDANLKGVIYGTLTVARQMVKQRSGHIINLGSVAGVLAAPGLSIYTATKFGVRGFSHSVRYDLKKYGIAVSVVEPTTVKTPMVARAVELKESAPLFAFDLLSVEALGRAIIEKVINKRKPEVILPTSSGFVARLNTIFPQLNDLTMPLILKLGARGQKKMLASKEYLNWR
jgi:3-oxoacyl-[acyl-carrier protein] reductase